MQFTVNFNEIDIQDHDGTFDENSALLEHLDQIVEDVDLISKVNERYIGENDLGLALADDGMTGLGAEWG